MIHNLRRCFAICRVYWGTCDSDWSSLAALMIFQMRVIAHEIRQADIIMDAKETAQEMEDCADDLLYLLEDRAYDEAGDMLSVSNWAERVQQLEDAAEKRFVDGIAKIRNWWD